MLYLTTPGSYDSSIKECFCLSSTCLLTMSTLLHSYYPLGIHIPGYLPNESSVPSLIGQFALLWAAIVGIAWLTISRSRPDASIADHLAFVWFCLSMFAPISWFGRIKLIQIYLAASIHLFFEGYFVVNHMTIGGKSHLFAELWKEYSLSDSRYLRSDAFLVCMESVTAVCHCLAFRFGTFS